MPTSLPQFSELFFWPGATESPAEEVCWDHSRGCAGEPAQSHVGSRRLVSQLVYTMIADAVTCVHY